MTPESGQAELRLRDLPDWELQALVDFVTGHPWGPGMLPVLKSEREKRGRVRSSHRAPSPA